ncbi:MAG TPA: hypothetical protein VJM79_04255, partial [Rhizorhapis sp.]|nr:hypothetical protein [Rhizorhapis sp.]
MPKISKVEAELQEATGVKPKKGEALQDYLKRIHGAISDLDDAAWKKLSTPAMNWGNAATKAFDKDKPLPEFEADADDAKPAKGKAAAAKGDDEDPGEGNDDDADGAADDETENSDDAEGDDAEAAAEDKTVSKTKTTKGGAA